MSPKSLYLNFVQRLPKDASHDPYIENEMFLCVTVSKKLNPTQKTEERKVFQITLPLFI
jgi:hypothetical protein